MVTAPVPMSNTHPSTVTVPASTARDTDGWVDRLASCATTFDRTSIGDTVVRLGARGRGRGGIDVFEPFGDRRCAAEVVAFRHGGHRTAPGVAAHHDAGNPHHRNGELDARRDAVGSARVDRDEIACRADHEQVARLAIGDQFRNDTCVGTADEQGVGTVGRRQAGEQIRLGGEDIALKVRDSGGEVVHGSLPSGSLGRLVPTDPTMHNLSL